MRQEYCQTTSPTSAHDGRMATDGIPAEDIHNQLDRILQAARFRGSLRLTRFLKFVVETALAGEPASIKAYTIAVGALGRPSDFDPQHDPIVRVEAGRLRAALARYYAEEGRNDLIVIDIPRGIYVPVFRRRDSARPPPPAPAARAAALPIGPAVHRQLFVASQAAELAAELKALRGALADSYAPLQLSAPSLLAPPLSPTASPFTIDETPDGHESVATLEPTSQPQPKLPSSLSDRGRKLSFAAAAKSRLGKFAPALRIALCIMAILAVLEVTFDIGHPITSGADRGLLFRLWGSQTSDKR